MQVYDTTIVCSKCSSENIGYDKEVQTLTSNNGRDLWSRIHFKCTCKCCGHQFEEIFSLQRLSIDSK